MGERGTTVTELLVTMAIGSVLLALAWPSFTALLQSNRITAASNEFLTALHLARSEAIRRNARTVVCSSLDGEQCADGGWDRGWIVFHDANNDAQHDAEEELVHVRPALSQTLRATGNAPVSKYVSYVPTGRALLVSGAFQAGTVTLCDKTGSSAAARQIIITSVGRPRIKKLDACPPT